MSYRRIVGDYKTYGYAGDPGWLSSIWKGIKKIAGPIAGAIIGGPIGAVIGGIGGGGGGGGGGKALTIPGALGGTQFGLGVSMPGGLQVAGTITPGQGRLPPFTATGPGVLPAGGRGGVCPPSGYHWAKDGSGRVVRNRRMNVCNPRALRRSMRRVQGFEKLAKRTIQFTRRTRMKKRGSS